MNDKSNKYPTTDIFIGPSCVYGHLNSLKGAFTPNAICIFTGNGMFTVFPTGSEPGWAHLYFSLFYRGGENKFYFFPSSF
jgi:hypothetical protein